MSEIISTGLLAYGMSGKIFQGPFIDAHPGFKLYAVTERNEKKAEKDFPGILSYDNIDDLIADEQIDLVVINTPNFLHYEHAKKALHGGKHILVEKPFAANTEEATEVFELAKTLRKKVFVFQSRRWDSDFNAVKKVVDSGKLGKISEAHFRYDRYKAGIGVKSFKEELVPATGLQYDLGPHLLDQAISLFGKPDSFHKILGYNRPGTKVDDYFSIHLSYPNSLNVFVHASMLVVDPLPSFVIHGEQGSYIKERADIQEEQLLKGIKPNDSGFGVEARGKEGKLTLIDKNGERTQQRTASESATYLSLFEDVYQSLVNDKPFPVQQEQVLAQLEILQS
jgi:scyllo-inositol 2-dehydrogenase (NADP+)